MYVKVNMDRKTNGETPMNCGKKERSLVRVVLECREVSYYKEVFPSELEFANRTKDSCVKVLHGEPDSPRSLEDPIEIIFLRAYDRDGGKNYAVKNGSIFVMNDQGKTIDHIWCNEVKR